MTERNSLSTCQLILILASFLLLCSGLQSAFGCQLQKEAIYRPTVRVNNCHRIINQGQPPACCQSEACHQTTPAQRDLDSPEYQTQHKNSHPLVHESRSLTPQMKAGKPFQATQITLPQFSVIARNSHPSLQALSCLRTVVLLN